ncbi:MAG: membrane protein of unknown function [Promethearchaeota archaeon]|jgi:hypothetical protein|nr:MAG: membrane protein of unknown function [Candidatus Lokiarchaeota archaeon]
MLFELNIQRDILLLLHYFAIFFVAYLVIQIVMKIREGKVISTTTGLAIYMITYGIFVYFMGLPLIYPELESFFQDTIMSIMIIYIGGMVGYIFLSELDDNLHTKGGKNSNKNSYLLTLISLGGFIIFILLGFAGLYDPFITFSIVLIPFIIATDKIIKKFRNLEVVKRENPGRWFYAGLTITGLSNAFSSFWMLWGEWFMYIRYATVILGSLFMVHGWRLLPNLSELDWMRKMDNLFVIHSESSSLLYQYSFKTDDVQKKFDSDLTGSAMGGVDMLLSEILAEKGHIREIEHEDKKLFFSHGLYTTSILITEGDSPEFRYRLDLFEINFENDFNQDELAHFSGEITKFQQADKLIREYFSH